MRIISGNFRGKKILYPKDLKTRPLKDLKNLTKIYENILQNYFK